MRQNVFSRASRIPTSFQRVSQQSRCYASRAQSHTGPHPTEKIPVKGALPVSNRTLRNVFIFGGGTLIGLYYGWRSSSNAVEIAIEKPWTTYTLEAKDPVSPTAAVFTLKSKSLATEAYDSLFRNAIWAVDIQQPQLQIVREYTPLPPPVGDDGQPKKDGSSAELHLLIREEYKGEVSGYLHRLPIGSNVEVSRPYSQVNLSQEDPDKMVFVVGGTGITTALQAIHALLETRQGGAKKPSIHILWANRRREDCLGGISDTPVASVGGGWLSSLPTWLGGSSPSVAVAHIEPTELGKSPIIDELRRLKDAYKGQLKVDYFVDEEGTSIKPDHVNKALSEGSRPDGKAFVAISGPEGFLVHFAGDSRSLKNRVSERPTTGLLAQLNQKDWKLMVLG